MKFGPGTRCTARRVSHEQRMAGAIPSGSTNVAPSRACRSDWLPGSRDRRLPSKKIAYWPLARALMVASMHCSTCSDVKGVTYEPGGGDSVLHFTRSPRKRRCDAQGPKVVEVSIDDHGRRVVLEHMPPAGLTHRFATRFIG